MVTAMFINESMLWAMAGFLWFALSIPIGRIKSKKPMFWYDTAVFMRFISAFCLSVAVLGLSVSLFIAIVG